MYSGNTFFYIKLLLLPFIFNSYNEHLYSPTETIFKSIPVYPDLCKCLMPLTAYGRTVGIGTI